MSNVKGREAAGRVTALTSRLTSHTSADERDSTSPAVHPVMRWKILCRRRDGGGKSIAVMDRINKSRQSVITQLTQGVEEVERDG